MVLQQFALLNSQPIQIAGIGLIKSPLLKDISPNNQENFMYYSLAMRIIFSKNKELVSLIKEFGIDTFNDWSDDDIASADKYDILVNSLDFVQLACTAFSIFFEGKLGFAPEIGFLYFKSGEEKFSGLFGKDKYLMVEDLFKQLVHSDSKYSEKELKYSSDKAKELWEKAEAFEEKTQINVNSKDYDIGNVISKLCSCGIGYNVNNIYDLTIYQLYDQFSAYIQNRISRLSENAYAHWGGDNFDMNAWLRSN